MKPFMDRLTDMSDLIKVADWAKKPRANVIFVHGLSGHAYDTWRRAPDGDSFWPLWLAEDVEGVSVYTLAYAAPASNWLGTAMPLQDRVGNVRARLLATPSLQDGVVCRRRLLMPGSGRTRTAVP